MFEPWFHCFEASGSDVQVKTSVTTGDNGTPVKDLGYLIKKVVTDTNELRIVVSV